MSAEGVKTAEEKAAEARRGPGASALGRRGGPHMQMGLPGEKSQNFVPSAKRLLGRLRPERGPVIIVVVLSVVSVVLNAVGPKILGHATDLIFEGFFGSKLAPGTTKAAVVSGLRSRGQGQLADLLSGMNVIPGVGIDFTALARVLLGVLGLYVLAAVLQWLAGRLLASVVQRTVFTLRSQVEAKLNRLPLPYFDGQPRGELLSRVTNDVDNVQTSLQQTLGQLLTSLLTVVAMVVMMFSISWTLALLALVTIPISILLTAVIARRSQKLFVQQWQHTGQLNGIIEEAFTGHGLVKVFGRQKQSQEDFEAKNSDLFHAAFGAQFISGIIMPAMMFIGNISYVLIAVVGGVRVASGTMSLGAVQAFIQYSRQFTQPLTQVASMANLLQSGVASAERVFEVLDASEQRPDPPAPRHIADSRGRVEFENVTFAYVPERPIIENLSLVVEPGQTVAIVGPTGAGKTTLVNLILRFYELSSGRITLDRVDITDLTRNDLRSRIGMVLQDTWLFAGTIRENIAYSRPDATEDEIIEAAQATYVDRFVHSLPAGYDTVLDAEAENLNLDVQPGQTVAIVGPTGAGKTTLVNLVMRFYELGGGRITLDGVDISSVPRADLRSNLGMVLQDTWLFHGTIRDNIAYGRPDASDSEIRAAARATYVDRFVHALPDGYDTVIDEEGSNVSVGEKQLITIARAFLADPALLILDEATSSVDTRTEVLVQKAMGALRHGRTSFVIAHRLSTIRDADVILVMEHGQIVEQGDHAGLLAARGAYYDLYQSQFSGATATDEEELPQLAGAGGGSRGPRMS